MHRNNNETIRRESARIKGDPQTCQPVEMCGFYWHSDSNPQPLRKHDIYETIESRILEHVKSDCGILGTAIVVLFLKRVIFRIYIPKYLWGKDAWDFLEIMQRVEERYKVGLALI